jgi:hypothetical protein
MKTLAALVAGGALAVLVAVGCLGSSCWEYEIVSGSWYSSCPILPPQTSSSGVFGAKCVQCSKDEKICDQYTAYICVEAGTLDENWRAWIESVDLTDDAASEMDARALGHPVVVWVTVYENGSRRPLANIRPMCGELQGTALTTWSSDPLVYSDGVLYVLLPDTVEAVVSFQLEMAVAGCDSSNDGGGSGSRLITVRCWLPSTTGG